VLEKQPWELNKKKENSSLWTGGSRTRPASTCNNPHINEILTWHTKSSRAETRVVESIPSHQNMNTGSSDSAQSLKQNWHAGQEPSGSEPHDKQNQSGERLPKILSELDINDHMESHNSCLFITYSAEIIDGLPLYV
jgi:hypothetical protein